MTRASIVAAARAAVGSRFRLHGRNPALGLDCVGLVAVALGGRNVPADYALRSGDTMRAEAALREAGLRPVNLADAGDVLLLRAGPGQLHLAIRSETGIIHADAVLRRVVERPGAVPFALVSAWRFPGREEGEG
ncbi:peptidoglycan endopeptidase [Sphingomonas sp. PL-96]|uniref:peptidoglycan endopeptidase n=1 Tax=Sphingomonas sp. PL-96 TaxID=2887201 RepID=UPI001E5EF97A|nr:peptidoglycan endopeptidase [Sphingomonas sp. PL-96]MCC2977399.1 peptidoglycan endopeptidase [Sphingomonas sp. PL-96]